MDHEVSDDGQSDYSQNYPRKSQNYYVTIRRVSLVEPGKSFEYDLLVL